MLKMTGIATAVALMASSLAYVSLAGAADDPMFSTGGYARGGQGLRTMKMMKVMDGDGDHMVSQDEFMKMHEGVFTKMDKNKDGMLSVDEWTDKHVSNARGSDGSKDHGSDNRGGGRSTQ
ncbi:MAG: hypothetical protein ACR2FI_00650 [Burkholderiales bacterium]|nr:hypothetical protein [Burkholderiales bacterium]MDQ3197374.1 hypothetical protein [Pseudomonadota bacterium]